MSNKTTFKRIALAVVAALGFGVLASGPSNAAIQVGGTMTATAVNTTVKAYSETATVNVAVSVTSLTDGDSISVTAIQTTGTTPGGTIGFRTPVAADSSNAAALAAPSNGNVFYVTTTADKVNTATGRFDIIKPTTAGTYTYTFYAAYLDASGNLGTAPTPVTYTFTVDAADLKPSASKSSAWLQELSGGLVGYSDAIRGDSVIATAKGTSIAAKGVIVMQQRNADSSTEVLTPESVSVVSSGVGLVARNTGTAGSAVGAFTALATDSIVVFTDGRAGKQTVTLSTSSMPNWKTFTITYTGDASQVSIASVRPVITSGDASTALQVTPKDAGDNLVTAATSLYVHSSDTKIVANSTSACSVTATVADGYGACALTMGGDSGTVKLKVANYAASATTIPTGAFVSNEISVVVTGSPAAVKISFDKRSYKPGEAAKIQVRVTDGSGRAVANQTVTGLFAAGGITVSPAGTGTISDTVVTLTAATYAQGGYDFTYTMPTTAGSVVASATGGAGLVAAGRVAVYDTVTVIDPAETAANSALEAAQDAADAAIEAGDAATLAQEAADEAAQAAQDAQATAQAAVDAVTALSGEVTKLVAQLATLQKIINRIAKKVGVKTK